MKIKVTMTKQEAFELTGCLKSLDNMYDLENIVYPEVKNEIVERINTECNGMEAPEFDVEVVIKD